MFTFSIIRYGKFALHAAGYREVSGDHSTTKKWTNGEDSVVMQVWGNQSGAHGYVMIWCPCDGFPYVREFKFDKYPATKGGFEEQLNQISNWLNQVGSQ